jgi:hypothetical protein
MPDYPVGPIDLSGLSTYPLKSRKSKVVIDELAVPPKPKQSFSDFWAGLPAVLAARDLGDLVETIHAAHRNGRGILWGLGAHVIKVGLSPLIIQLMREGFISGLALNGAGIIHDFEMALVGQTSEEVEQVLGSGEFGFAEETGSLLNRAIREGAEREMGLGQAVGAFLDEHKPQFMNQSLLWNGYQLSIPVTVHVALERISFICILKHPAKMWVRPLMSISDTSLPL